MSIDFLAVGALCAPTSRKFVDIASITNTNLQFIFVNNCTKQKWWLVFVNASQAIITSSYENTTVYQSQTSGTSKRVGYFFPIVSVDGPRQAGKTTLLKAFYPNFRHVSLENPDVLYAATKDPKAFLKEYDDLVIFDEAQRLPSLFSYLQGMVDGDRRPGRFIISGSQNFLLRKNITQSLAGRVGVARLLPLDLSEMRDANHGLKLANRTLAAYDQQNGFAIPWIGNITRSLHSPLRRAQDLGA
jgi:hypothetical protein